MPRWTKIFFGWFIPPFSIWRLLASFVKDLAKDPDQLSQESALYVDKNVMFDILMLVLTR